MTSRAELCQATAPRPRRAASLRPTLAPKKWSPQFNKLRKSRSLTFHGVSSLDVSRRKRLPTRAREAEPVTLYYGKKVDSLTPGIARRGDMLLVQIAEAREAGSLVDQEEVHIVMSHLHDWR